MPLAQRQVNMRAAVRGLVMVMGFGAAGTVHRGLKVAAVFGDA